MEYLKTKSFFPENSHICPNLTKMSQRSQNNVFFGFFEKFCHQFFLETICNPMQNIWNKIEKSSKTGQDKKSLISTFVCFLTATTKV